MEQQDKIIKKFNLERIAEERRIPIICIYNCPADYPRQYVARLWDAQTPTNIITTADSLEEIRQTIPANMTCIQRSEKDDACIVETWI